jgi:hypothetical protein
VQKTGHNKKACKGKNISDTRKLHLLGDNEDDEGCGFLLAWNLCTGDSLCEFRSSTAYFAAVSIATKLSIAFFNVKPDSDSNLL